tara:strand:+ start:301 stop:675 length:375 start_codon:yes stop_codon:yes gene_type:complete
MNDADDKPKIDIPSFAEAFKLEQEDREHEGPLAQRLSNEFINAQNAMQITVQELRAKCRGMNEKLNMTLASLETDQSGANIDMLAGISEQAMSAERLARLLVEQRELMEAAIDNTRAVARRRVR